MRLLEWCFTHRRLLAVGFVSLVLSAALAIAGNHITGQLDSQQEAERWSDGTIPYHQVSAFMQADSQIGKDRISEVRSNLQTKLSEASYGAESVNGRLWVDAYAARDVMSVSKETDLGAASVDRVQVFGVSDDFFLFHPLTMLSGNCFFGETVGDDGVVLDEQTAWTLFGATDVAGKMVQVGGENFVIRGVYRPSEEKYETLARGSESCLFMSYDAFSNLSADTGIISYEAVLPNPVKGFALLALETAFDGEETTLSDSVSELNFTEIDYVDNTARFQTQKLLAKLFYLPRRLMRVNEIAYPYWENAVRAQEIRLGILALLRLLFLLIPLGIFGISIALLLKKEYSNCKAFLRRKCVDGLETLNRRLAERREKRKKEEE